MPEEIKAWRTADKQLFNSKKDADFHDAQLKISDILAKHGVVSSDTQSYIIVNAKNIGEGLLKHHETIRRLRTEYGLDQLTKWKAADGKLFDSRRMAVEYDAKAILREALRPILSRKDGHCNSEVLDEAVSRWADVKRHIDDYIVATSIHSGPE